MAVAATSEMKLRVADVSGQKIAYVHDIPTDSTVGELIQDLLPQMRLPDTDATGRPLVYHARLQREGRHLHASEKLLEVVIKDDWLTLQPNVEAGRF